jgi:hypothetical protein
VAATVTPGAYAVPEIISIDDSGLVDITTTAGAALAGATTNTAVNVNRFLFGLKDSQYNAASAATLSGKFTENVKSITIVEPVLESYKIYLREESSSVSVEVNDYTRAELMAMAMHEPRGFLMGGSVWSVYATKNYIPIRDLLADNYIALDDVKSLSNVAGDGFRSTTTKANLDTEQYFYPATGPAPADISYEGVTTVGAVLALDFNNADVTDTAGATMNRIINADTWLTAGRILIGLSKDNYDANNAAGNRFVTNPLEMTVVVSDGYIGKRIVELGKKADDLDKQIAEKEAANTTLTGNNAALENEKNQWVAQKAELEAQKAALQVQLDTANFKGASAKISKLTAGKKRATVTWKKIGNAVGYQVVYAASKNFKGKKTVTIRNAAAVKTTIKSLKKGKTYYFKVRGYASIGGKTVYTKYSPVKKVKITK